MPFQPFGYPFEVRSALDRQALKRAVRAKKKRWFDKRSGARGWIIGPFVCLWISAFDSHGPMLIGRIVDERSGTRIVGRAGSDLNGMIGLALWYPAMALILWMAASAAQLTIGLLVVCAVIFGFLGPLAFWIAHKDRRQAEPLVRFLEKTASPARDNRGTRIDDHPLATDLSLIIDGEAVPGPVTSRALHDALLGLAEGEFIILARTEQHYIQSMARNGNFILEQRSGDSWHHFKAVRRPAISADDQPGEMIGFDAAYSAFLAFASDKPMPPSLDWKRKER